jgi:hypothetical protein
MVCYAWYRSQDRRERRPCHYPDNIVVKAILHGRRSVRSEETADLSIGPKAPSTAQVRLLSNHQIDTLQSQNQPEVPIMTGQETEDLWLFGYG